MNYFPLIPAAILLTCGLIATAIAIPIAIHDDQEPSNGGGDGSELLEVEILENYGPDWVSFTPFTLQLQSFVANGDGELVYNWQWDDGTNISDEPNLILEVSENVPGGYRTISLTVTDEDGDTNSDSFTFEVGAPWWWVIPIEVDIGNEFPDDDPTAGVFLPSDVVMFAFPRAEGPPPVEVFFSATGIFCIGYLWDFGDGSNVSSGSTTSHTYYSSGHFNITLSAIFPGPDENSTDVVIIGTTDVMILDEDPDDEISIDMDIPDFPENYTHYVMDLTIYADPIRGPAPLYVNFNTNMAPVVTSGFLWNFGDGGPVSFDRASSHIYIDPGTYRVTVTYSNSMGIFGFGEIHIIVQDSQDDFAIDIEVIPTDHELSYRLIAHPSLEISLTYEWTFAHEPQETGMDILHHFQSYGMNYAQVHVYNEDLSLNATARVELFVPHAGAPSVHFLIHPAIDDPAYFQFEPIVGGGVPSYTYFWYFGDGTSSNDQYPTHYYYDEGYFKVELYVEDGDGRVGYYSDFVYAYSSMMGEF